MILPTRYQFQSSISNNKKIEKLKKNYNFFSTKKKSIFGLNTFVHLQLELELLIIHCLILYLGTNK